MLNTKNLKEGEVVIIQTDDRYYLAEIKEIIPKNKIIVFNGTGKQAELISIKYVHKILNKFAFEIERKKNQEDTKC